MHFSLSGTSSYSVGWRSKTSKTVSGSTVFSNRDSRYVPKAALGGRIRDELLPQADVDRCELLQEGGEQGSKGLHGSQASRRGLAMECPCCAMLAGLEALMSCTSRRFLR